MIDLSNFQLNALNNLIAAKTKATSDVDEFVQLIIKANGFQPSEQARIELRDNKLMIMEPAPEQTSE
jgi:type IV secretory pathway TrbL component